ncbi:MAG: hypothetical protein LAO78_24905 [Acidobacteriia bacterium]|nr:hypothetical protein [Terriglobia bacterium]
MKVSLRSNLEEGRLFSGFFCVLTLSLLAAAFAGTPAFAAPPSLVPITSCNTVINQPGSYFLANDLSCFGQDGINIIVDHVTVSLNGHSITADVEDFGFFGNGISVGIGVLKGNAHVTIMGPGTITGFNAGINFEQVTQSTVANVMATGNFFGFVINGGFAAGCAQSCPSTKNTFQGNISTNNDQHGFTMNGANQNTYLGNTASNNFNGHGILIFIGTGNDVNNNVANNNGDGGITLVGGTATGNNVIRNTANGNGSFDLFDTSADCTSNTWRTTPSVLLHCRAFNKLAS